METREFSACMANGTIAYLDRDEAVGHIEWIEHPKFKGVFLKHLVKGADTDGQLSCHLVKLDPGCVLEEHTHESQWELHEVIAGEGDCILGAKALPYHPGRMTVIPKGTPHQVAAKGEGLVLLAKFFPALL